MEKRRPTYDLEGVKAVLGDAATLAATTTAFGDALRLGFDRAGVAWTISRMEHRMFVKSMTTFADSRMWQDVYHVPARGLLLYVKFQADMLTDFKLVSFKQK